MFNGKLLKRIELLERQLDEFKNTHVSEVDYLRSQNMDLHTRLMSFADDIGRNYLRARSYNDSVKVSNEQKNRPVFSDALGRLDTLEAVTDEEKKEKANAPKEIMSILGIGR